MDKLWVFEDSFLIPVHNCRPIGSSLAPSDRPSPRRSLVCRLSASSSLIRLSVGLCASLRSAVFRAEDR
eukprot:scaffold194467_cov27-Tisochrysis_lutea.AAC.1